MTRKDKIETLQGVGVILLVIGFITAFVWVATYLENKSNSESCLGKFQTSACLKQKLKEAEAKEEYQRKLKELQQ